MENEVYVIGVDIGGTNLRIGLVDSEKNLSDFHIFEMQKIKEDNRIIENLISFLKQYISKIDKDKKIAGLSAGFPSTIDKSRRRLLSTPNIAGLDNVSIVDRFEKELNIPICIDRDVNMLLLHDMYRKSIPHNGICTGFYVGTGFGNAISINGEILIGKNGSAAELGHIPSRDVMEVCGCGNTSCVELFASGKYLSYLCETKLGGCDIKTVFSTHEEDTIIRKYIHDLAIPIATEINILDPDYVILGGGVVQMENFPKDLLESGIRKYVRKPYPEKKLEFIYSISGQEIGVIGAGICGFRRLL